MTAYDLYCYLDNSINAYIDSLLIKEDINSLERKKYEHLKDWMPNTPDDLVKITLASIDINFGEKSE